MRAILRTLGLFAPLIVVVALAVVVVLAIFHAPVALLILAALTGVFCLAALVVALVVGTRRRARGLTRTGASVRGAVADVVRDPGDPARRRELARHLDSFDEIRAVGDVIVPRHREILRRVLHELGAAERLEERARAGGRWERVMVARSLGWLASPDAAMRLDALARDEDVDVALAGTSGLAAVPGAAAYRSLVRLLADGPLPPSRTATVMEDSVYADPLTVLAEEVPEGPVPMRFWGAYLAGRTGDPRAFDLLARLASDDDADVRANAAEGLSALPVPEKAGLLLGLSRDEQWFVRAHAARGLDAAGEPGVERLTELLADRSWWVRENAALTLAAVGEPAVPALREKLESADRFARNKAAEVLVRLGFLEREIETYLEGNGTRWQARENLVLMGRAEVISSLSTRFLAVPGDRQLELVRVVVEIDDTRLRPTLNAMMGQLKTGRRELRP